MKKQLTYSASPWILELSPSLTFPRGWWTRRT